METTARPRRARRRDRHGRGPRGPGVRPHRPGSPETRTTRERFDALTLELVGEIDDRWAHLLGLVEYAVEDTPVVPEEWTANEVPLSSLIRGAGARPARLVLFRRPIERRCASAGELRRMVRSILVQQIAELLGLEPEDVDAHWEG